MKRKLPPGTVTEDKHRKSLEHKMDRILYFIVMHGPSNKTVLEERLKIDKPTIYRAVDRLLDAKQIYIDHRAMNGMVKYYELTTLGLWNVLHFVYVESGEVENTSRTIDFMKRLFTKYPNWIPDIAYLWPAFEETSHKENCNGANRLVDLALFSVMWIDEDEIAKALRGDISEEDLADKLLFSFLTGPADEDSARWLRALQTNLILRDAIVPKIQKRISDLQELIHTLTKGDNEITTTKS